MSILVLLHTDITLGVWAPSLLCSQHLGGPQTTNLNSQNKYQIFSDKNHALNSE